MYVIQPKKDNVIRGKINVTSVGTGHRVTPRGGKHDNRPKRLRTRQNAMKRALSDW